MRGVTVTFFTQTVQPIFQLTRLMRGVTMDVEEIAANPAISTHTPHARRDMSRFLLSFA